MSYPSTSDGKPIYLSSAFPPSSFLYITGSADDPTKGRGQGQQFQCSLPTTLNVPTSKAITWQFNDSVYLQGGIINYAGAVFGDTATFSIYAPATPVKPNIGNTGAINVTTVSGVGIITPAAGGNTGAYDFMSATSAIVPVPAPDTIPEDADEIGLGAWDWSDPATGSGLVTPTKTPGQGLYNLYTTQIPLVNFCNNYQLMGSGQYNISAPIKSKKILPQWVFSMTLTNSGHNAAVQVVWGLVTGRAATT